MELVMKITKHVNQRRELDISQKLNQLNLASVPQIVDWGEIDPLSALTLQVPFSSCFIVQQKLGPTLLKIHESPIQNVTREDALKVGIQLIRSIEEFHVKNLLHGDIKLDNIMVSKQEDDGDIIQPMTSRQRGINNQLYLIDYGHTEFFRSPDANGRMRHRPNL